MGSLHYLKYAKRMFYKRGASPLYFVYFVTENCNAFCKHCLLGQRTERVTDELTIDEIEKVSASMGDMLFFTPTGGEPFLRRDLPEIVKIFHINNHALNVGIPTNGSLTARVLRSVKTMLDENPDLDLHIDVSIDGLPELHDEIRGVPGLFNRAIETYQQLRELEHHYPRFSTCIQVTVSSFNQHQLLDLYDYLKRDVGVNTVFSLLTRGEPSDPVAKDIDIETAAITRCPFPTCSTPSASSGPASSPRRSARIGIRFLVMVAPWGRPCSARGRSCLASCVGAMSSATCAT